MQAKHPQDGDPSLEEVLAEPIVRALMARDGVSEGEVRKLLHRFGDTCGEPPPPESPTT
jgi:hypothetical protein